MSPKPVKETLAVQIGRQKLLVPICEDEETTLDIIKQVEERLTAIEEERDWVNSTQFATLAAYLFAVDLYNAQQEHAKDTREFLVALNKLAETLRDIAQSPAGDEK